jgi:hypothetical protein
VGRAPKAVADGDRLGCSTYCQTAGGYGAAGNGPKPPQAVTIENTGTTIADADGYVPVTLKCHRTVRCLGVIRLGAQFLAVDAATGNAIHPVVGGASDLLVNAGATRTIGVPLSRPGAMPGAVSAIALRRSHGPTPFGVQIDVATRSKPAYSVEKPSSFRYFWTERTPPPTPNCPNPLRLWPPYTQSPSPVTTSPPTSTTC